MVNDTVHTECSQFCFLGEFCFFFFFGLSFDKGFLYAAMAILELTVYVD